MPLERRSIQIESTPRRQFDGAAERFGIHIGPIRIGNYDLADESGRDLVESHVSPG
jgi:hypothetical protein